MVSTNLPRRMFNVATSAFDYTRKALLRAHKKPIPTIQIISGITFLLAFLLALMSMFTGDISPQVLVLLGMPIILLAVATSTNATVVLIGVLVAAVLIAPENYTMDIVRTVLGREPPTDYPDRAQVQSDPSTISENQRETERISELIEVYLTSLLNSANGELETTEETISSLLQAQQDSNSTLDFQSRLQRTIEDGEIRRIAERVRNRDALYPLEEIGEDRTQTLVEDFGDTEYFITDMAFFLGEGIINAVSLDPADLEVATLTSLGERVLDVIHGPPDDHQDIRTATVGQPLQGRLQLGSSGEWFRLRIQERAAYRIKVDTAGLDTYLELYDQGPPPVELAWDDDSVEVDNIWDAAIEYGMAPGEYLIRVSELDQAPGDFSLLVSRL